MWINLLVIFITLALGAYYIQSEKVVQYTTKSGKNLTLILSGRKQYIILVCTMLILQSGLRNWGVGSDTYAYYEAFEYVKGMSWKDVLNSFIEVYQLGEGKDPGYNLFQKIIQVVIHDYQLYLILIAVIFFSAFGNFIYRNTSRVSDAVLAFTFYSVLFYAFFSITGHRQTIATAVALFGFELIKKRKLLLFVIIIIIAATIHKSVLIFLPLYFVVKLKNVKMFYGFILAIFPILFLFRVPVSNFFKLIGGYAEDFGIYAQAGTPVFTALMILIAVFVFMRYKEVLLIKPEAKLYYIAFALALFFVPLTWVNPSAMRVVQYFSIFMVVLIPVVVRSFTLNSVKWERAVYYLILAALIIVFIQSGGIEYKFFWQEMRLGDNY